MISYTADYLFDGEHFLETGSSIEVDAEGVIQSINQPGNNTQIQLEGLLMPGMVNAHCHLELSHLKNQVARSTGLVGFLQAVISQRSIATEDERMQAMQQAEQEMISQGIVAVGDICNGLSTSAIKSKGGLHYHSFVECFGLNPLKAEEIMQQAIVLQQEFLKTHAASVVLHAPYSVSSALIQKMNEYSEGQIQTIHNQECEAENQLFARGEGAFKLFIEGITGKAFQRELIATSSLQAYMPLLNNLKHIILVHNTQIHSEDIQYLKERGGEIYFCLCPNANRYIENQLPPVELLLAAKGRIILGTDSLASNDGLSIVSEIQTLMQAFPHIDPMIWLQAATLHGAQALRMEQQLGSFSVGKKPGMVQWKNWGSERKAEIQLVAKA